MESRANNQVSLVTTRVLRGGPWQTTPWDERSRRFGQAMLESLRDGLAVGAVMPAVARGYAAGRAAVPQAAGVWHETWGRVVLVWSSREVVCAALADPNAVQRETLLAMATQMAAAGGHLGLSEAAPAGDGLSLPFEHMVDAARDALTEARDGVSMTATEGGYLAAYLGQLKHIASLLAVGGHSVDSLVRGAVARADRVVRREALPAWMDAGLPTRQAWTQRGLVDAAWALAAWVPRAQARPEHARMVSLWLARTACALAARVDRVDQWVPTVPEDAVREHGLAVMVAPQVTVHPVTSIAGATKTVMDSTTKPLAGGTEATMDNKVSPLLKTLETDAGDAAWRMAGSQFVKLAREPIVALLSRHLAPGDESIRARIAAFLETELGAALLAGILSAGLTALPLPGNDLPQKLARELRVRSMAGAGDVIADVLMGPLRQVAVLYLQGNAGGAGSEGNTVGVEPAGLPDTAQRLQTAMASSLETMVTRGT